MKTHELAHKLLSMENMDINIPLDPENRDYIQPLESFIIGTSGTKGSSDYPYKETLILKGNNK